MVYLLALVCAMIFSGIFVYALGSPFRKQPLSIWKQMELERGVLVVDEERNIEYQFGDILLLLPLVPDQGNRYILNVADYFDLVSKLLVRRLLKEYGEDNIRIELLRELLNYKSIDRVTNVLLSGIGMRYLHVDMYLGGGWAIGGLGCGVQVKKLTKEELRFYDVYRFKGNLDEDKFMKACKKYWNTPYDEFSMSFNGFLSLFGIKNIDDVIVKYDNELRIMCSEFGARVMNKAAGEKLFPYPEHVIPDDFASRSEFECVYWNSDVERPVFEGGLGDVK